MSKKIIAILLSVICIMSLTACGEQTQYTFDGAQMSASATDAVSGNGENVVFVGDYIYYINATRSVYSSNVFGEVSEGAIMIQNTKTGAVECIQPKLVADQNGVGLSIYNGKIYYTSPCDTKDRDGDVQYGYLDVMSCDLDGANPQKLYTFASARSVEFICEDGKVYGVWEEAGAIKGIDLSASDIKSFVITEEYSGGVLTNAGIFLVSQEDGYQDIVSVSVSGEEKTIVSGKTSESEKHTISIKGVNDGKILFSMTDSVLKGNTITYLANLDGTQKTAVTALTTTANVIEYNGGYIFQSGSTIYYKLGETFTKLHTSSVDFFCEEGGMLFFGKFEDSKATLSKLDIQAKIADSETKAVEMLEEDGIYSGSFAPLVCGGGKGYFYSADSEIRDMHMFDIAEETAKSIVK